MRKDETTTVAVPTDELLEAIAHVGALELVLAQLEGGFDSELGERIQGVATGLTACLFEQPDGDREYEQHPLNVRIESRVAELAGEVLVQVADSGALDPGEIAYRGARLLGDAREMRAHRTIGLWRLGVARKEFSDATV